MLDGEFDMIRHRYNLNGEDARRGFTLIELLVVIVILGVLTAIAVPIYLNQRVAAWKATVVSDVHSAAEQVELASYHGDGSLTQLSAYHDARAAADDTVGGPTILTDKTFANADGKYDGHDTIGSEPVPVSAGNTTEIQVRSDNSYTIYGANAHVHDWVYRYDSTRGAGEWEHGSYPSDPSAPDPDDDCPVVLDGTKLIIGKDGMRCKLRTAMVNSAAGTSASPTRSKVTEVDLHGHIVIVDGALLFSNMKSLTTMPYLPGQSVTSSAKGVSYSGMFKYDFKLTTPDSISHWDTLNVTDMSLMFYDAYAFNQSVSNFNTGKVTDMDSMFQDARAFNQPVSNFNTSNVTAMGSMFGGAYNFNQPVSNFNTSKVTRMDGMFQDARVFNQSVSNFDTSNVTSMTGMFRDALAFNQSVSNFNTSNVTRMAGMFEDARVFNQSVSNFNTSNVIYMSWMFADAHAFNQSVSNFDTSKVTNMYSMFFDAYAFNQSVSKFDTSNVTDMSLMFEYAYAFNQPVSNFDTRNVTNMDSMFYRALAFNQSVSNFDTSKVTNMSDMFREAHAFNQSVSNFDTSKVTNMHGMFEDARAFNQPVPFDTSKVTDMGWMFENATTFNQDLTGWNVANVTRHDNFSNGSALTAAHLPHFKS
jgi:prepilin-type N-terminal cleavage/methylation domain-containing protein